MKNIIKPLADKIADNINRVLFPAPPPKLSPVKVRNERR